MGFNLFTFTKKVNRPFLLDGAMGSLLQQQGIKSTGALWTSLANIEHPEIVLKVHKNYIKAGSDIITTNTFRTNPAAVKTQNKFSYKSLVKSSVKLAKDAAIGYNVLLAGSNAPAEDCYQVERLLSKRELENNHKQHIEELMKSGCDLILNETQSHFDEIKIICDFCYREKIPYIISLFVTENLKLLSGETVIKVIDYCLNKNSLCISFNCIKYKVFNRLAEKINFNFNWGFYLNLGLNSYRSNEITKCESPKSYTNFVIKYLEFRPSFIGGCCGSNPNHIKKLRQTLNGNFNN